MLPKEFLRDTDRLKEPYKTRKVFSEMTNFNVAYSIAHHEAMETHRIT